MRKKTRIIALSLLVVSLFLPTRWVSGQVEPEALLKCAEFAFSTEEDFVTNRPEPPSDGNRIISDGDLLGPNCEVCARNRDLVGGFDVNPSADLGLDAVDVIDAANWLVVLSTELDSPNVGQFTAGDLLIVSKGAPSWTSVIPNVALTDPFQVPYDIGLDAVHLVGDPQNIIAFLVDASSTSRDGWLQAPGNLSNMLKRYGIDILFSTEGTFTVVGRPGFLDGDLLSARDGVIVAANSDLLPTSVPAGIPNQGVDFGLDAATADRPGTTELIHFSTEILYEGDTSFTDGDMLQYDNGIVATNADLVKCFEPKANFLGLDALSVNLPPTPSCVSRITRVAGVDVADIGTDGMAIPGSVGIPSIMAPVPFGGLIDIEGTICDDVQAYRVVYRLAGSGQPWTGIPVLVGQGWKVKVDAFFPPYPDCNGQMAWFSDTSGSYDGNDYRHLTEPGLGGCNPGLALTVWDSDDAVAGGDELYELVLVAQTATDVVSDTARLVQLDNTPPTAELDKQPGTCDAFTDANMPLMVTGRISDTHFYRSRLQITGDSYGTHSYGLIAYYDDLADNLIETGTASWNAFVDLQAVDVHHLSASPVACGYTVSLTAWERTLWCNFKFPNNQAYHYPGHRHDTDSWTFEYTPSPP